MGGNAALANEFELPFSDLTPTEREMVARLDRMETENTTMVTRIVELENQLRGERDERQALERRLKNVEGSRTETVALNGNGGQAEKQDDEARSVTSVGYGDGDDDGSVGQSYAGALTQNSQRIEGIQMR
ncbi:hypothetical protein HPB47_020952 [Ixodes persulcatus]|uniref:Uncharacterized protein n=1 Tax=Ixodes persulcatus TaxID=34615 RepID=A0AC60QDY5_IXOPE|nr:hypothetical protein HPB47_020952 [Ixodes persulcatus]